VLTVLNCLAYEHDLRGIVVAACVCILGCILTMRLFSRTRRTDGLRRITWLFLSGVMCGSTIWTTHFVAMIGYNVPVPHAYDTVGTLLSLLIAITVSTLGLTIASLTKTSILIEIGGAVLGLGIAAMHFVGMAAFRVEGRFEWDTSLVVASIVFGALFGAIATNRIGRPVTRFCRYGGAIALILGVVSMHFTAMGAATLIPDPSVIVPPRVISNELLVIAVLAVMALVMGTGISGYVIDAQNQHDAVQRYRHLALHDATTGLPNRAHLATKLETALGEAAAQNARVVAIAIDLDRFKDVNDVHGHAAGDHVLRALSERLSSMLGAGEFLARIGGDEFVAVKENAFTVWQAMNFAQSIHTAICAPIERDGSMLTVGASLGVAIYPDDGHDAESILGKADLAMYRAKQTPSEKICRYERSMDETQRARAALGMELRHALERGELELYYQPQNDVASGDLIGYEVLLRWNHPERGLVSPVEFIPIAEENGLILSIGEWVLKEACREAAGWGRDLKVAVNVAPAQVAQSNLAKIVHETLLETGLPASRLELEITESSIIGDHQHALHVIRQLKALGITIAMDDYGTGYSSLSTLQTFPFDKIKIDRSFVNAVTTSEQASAIVRSTIILANSLKIPVLAEGVETDGHLAFLRAQGCHEAQGYFFGRPQPVSAIRTEARKQAPPPKVEKARSEASPEPLPSLRLTA
jgi:diguanylate cyclase